MDQKPLTKRQQQALDTKQRIYEAAVSLIEQYGFDNVQIEDISRKAGVSMGLFYKYFVNKSDILTEGMILQTNQEYLKIYEERLPDYRGKEKIIKFSLYAVEYHLICISKKDLRYNYANILKSSSRSQSVTSEKRALHGILDESVIEMLTDIGMDDRRIQLRKNVIVKNLAQLIRGIIFDYLIRDDFESASDIMRTTEQLISTYLTGLMVSFNED